MSFIYNSIYTYKWRVFVCLLDTASLTNGLSDKKKRITSLKLLGIRYGAKAKYKFTMGSVFFWLRIKKYQYNGIIPNTFPIINLFFINTVQTNNHEVHAMPYYI